MWILMSQEKSLILDRYRVIKVLEGGMGIVYLCVDEKNNYMPSALK
jgi:hypothetical protein